MTPFKNLLTALSVVDLVSFVAQNGSGFTSTTHYLHPYISYSSYHTSMSLAIKEQPIQLRFLVCCPRSGSTMFMRIFAENQDCAVSSRLVFTGNRTDGSSFQPDYTIFTDPGHHPVVTAATRIGKTFLINKDELGHDRSKNECDYDIFPDFESSLLTKPAFLFRDPVRIFDSWKALGWTDAENLRLCFMKLKKMSQARSDSYVIIYEKVVRQPDTEVRALCSCWGIHFKEEMLQFRQDFGEFYFHSDRERIIYCDQNPPGLFDTVKRYSEVQPSITSHQLLDADEITMVEKAIGKEYLQMWGPDFEHVRSALQSKQHFAFDLDDTLHNFRTAAGAALEAVLTKINAEHGSDVDVMRKNYRTILAEKTSSAFVDGRTSRDYRKERFEALMRSVQLAHDDNYLENLADLYQDALSRALRLKPGAMDLLKLLKSMNKRIIIVTEGPEDAQLWTLEQLGIRDLVDFVATTNRFGVSKVDGLLEKVMQALEISATDLVFVGDNKQRDIEPAVQANVFAIHYAENDNISLERSPIRVNTHYKICAMVETTSASQG